MRAATARATVLPFGVVAVLAAGGLVCAPAPDPNARAPLAAPAAATFPPVSAFLDHRCGSLDCHGQVGRNLILYGHEGLRLDPADVPGGSDTTAAEIAANYDSVVGLEPELMAAVVEEGGAHPERLTLVRKARGTEHHKGGALVIPGDIQDQCLIGWLAGMPNDFACVIALGIF